MRPCYRIVGLLVIAISLFTTCLVALANQPQAGEEHPVQTHEDDLVGGFLAAGPAVNVGGQTGQAPALAAKPDTHEPWVALAQADKIVVAQWLSGTQQWAQQGAALSSNASRNPSLGFAGTTPWVVWSEQAGTIQHLMAARFEGNAWQPTGLLNRDPSMNADHPALAVRSAVSPAEPSFWVAWDEADATGKQQILVSQAVSDANATGGYTWQAVGSALNVSGQANATQPDIAFAGQTAWVTWQERGNTGVGRLFAKRVISDNWQPVGRSVGCNSGQSCLLNNSAAQDASAPHIATGQLAGETSVTPWLVFTEKSSAGVDEVRVLRLDTTDDLDPANDRFRAVGGAVNQQCLSDSGLSGLGGTQPDIYFVGNVPHIAWIEQQTAGTALYICHLGDARSGQERWDLDSYFPINRNLQTTASAPSLGSDGATPFVAWQESALAPDVFVAYRSPTTPAWGRNYPPFIRTISWSRNLQQAVFSTAALEHALQVASSTRPLTLTTSCDHAQGWEHIQEIQFKIANPQMTAFLGRYVAAEDKVYVANPNQPGVFLGGVRPGTAVAPIDTVHATLYVHRMQVRQHGLGSPALDIDWVVSFKETTMFLDLKQSINIIYDNGQSTGFFETGLLSFDYRIYLPTVNRP